MTIYDGGSMGYVLITPFKAKFTDLFDSARLCCRIISDNTCSECQLYWELQDEFGNRTTRGNATIGGDNYTSWTGDSEYIFTYLLSTLPAITLLSAE